MESLCPILGRTTVVEPTQFSRESWHIVKCTETGFVFLANPPAYEQLESEFAWELTSKLESQRRFLQEPLLSRISLLASRLKKTLFPRRNRFFDLSHQLVRNWPPDRPITFLDIGCGGGELLEEIHGRFAAVNRQLIPQGIEVSKQLAAIANECFTALSGRLVFANAVDGTSQFADHSVDVVIMSSFLEHECQPLLLLRRLRTILTDDGGIVLKVPNFACINRRIRNSRWCGFRFPDHVNYFTPYTLRRLAEEAGFVVARQHLLDRLPSSDTMYAVLKKRC